MLSLVQNIFSPTSAINILDFGSDLILNILKCLQGLLLSRTQLLLWYPLKFYFLSFLFSIVIF